MKSSTVLRMLAVVFILLVGGWIVYHTRWVEIEVDNDARGLAATDEYYSLRHILEGAGSTLETRTSLEPLPPPNATLLLDSGLWNIFPERDARLKAWVEHGGHLVVLGRYARSRGDDMRWVPLSFVTPKSKDDAETAKSAASAASDADDEDDADDDAPATKKKPSPPDNRQRGGLSRLLDTKHPWRNCTDFEETPATTQPAYEPGRVYRGCSYAGSLRTLNHVVPTWQLTGTAGTLAMRVDLGQGSITGVSPNFVTDNRGILRGDNALIAAAILRAAPGRAVWIVGDEAREPLLGWLWHEARTPFLLALAAVALALWRLMVRFGPREAVPPQARRSMGEQVRGTGHFIASTDPRALHEATRKAFEELARLRVEGWATLDNAERIAALASAVARTHALDQPTLLASLTIGGGATPTQILTAIAVLEQARRALLRASAPPLAT
ncbi:MAG: DUF4350 domain-containing protein [Burkholderiaceae bacterium]